MWLLLSFTVLVSCTDDSKAYLVGEDFINLDSRLVVIDTLTLQTGTIQLDSVITTGSNRLLIGALQDQKFGNLKSQSYFTLVPQDFFIDEKATYDSIALILRYDRYYYGDTLQTLTYRVHEITEKKFEPKDKDETQFYNTSTLDYNNEPLGELTFKAYPYKKDSINITLKPSFGENLFKNFQKKDVKDIDDLEKIFTGITVVPDSNNNTVLGFKPSAGKGSVIRMYYTLDDGLNSDNDRYTDFDIREHFNNIISDNSSTLLNSIIDDESIIPSSKTDNQMYVRSGVSLGARLEIPHVRDLTSLESENGGTVINATLKMYPVRDSHNENISAIDSLVVYVIDNKNRFVKPLLAANGKPVYALLNSYDTELNFDYYYSADLTAFINETQTSPYLTKYALLFQLRNNNKSVDKLLIYDSKSGKDYKMKIELTYLVY